MAEVVKQAEVLRTVIDKLQKTLQKMYDECPSESTWTKCKVRAMGNWPEKFQKSCLFVGATSVMRPQAFNWMEKELTIQIFYYPSEQSRCKGFELEFMQVIDMVQEAFSDGIIKAGERALKIESVEDDRVGEEHDILEITMTIPYLETTKQKVLDSDNMIAGVTIDVTHDGGRNQQEIVEGRYGETED